jgi:predicted SAM-dependent methyltransferase
MVAHTINLNYEWYPGIDLTFDIRRPLPIATGRLRGVYSEHVLEHLPVDSLPFILSEWKRVLMPGLGRVRVLVPDAEPYLATYMRICSGEKVQFPNPNQDEMPNATPMMHVNRCFRSYEHLYAYDYETLSRMLADAGFVDINACEHLEGGDPNLLLDSEQRKSESLRIEAVAPAL